MVFIQGIRRMFKDRSPIVIYTGHTFLLAAKSERFAPSDMKIKGTSASRTLNIDSTSIGLVLSSGISSDRCLPLPPVHSARFGIEVFQWQIAGTAMLSGVNEIVSVGWLPHQPSHAFDEVSTPVLDKALVIVIPS